MQRAPHSVLFVLSPWKRIISREIFGVLSASELVIEKNQLFGIILNMEISIYLAKFWGGLFMILGLLSVGAKLLGRVIGYTEDRTVTISTGYITLLLGLITVVLHNIWVRDWKVAITILGWMTLLKGVLKIGFPGHIRKNAQMFKSSQLLWGGVIFLVGVWFFWMSC